ncbi:MAG: hypothetical protein R3B13_30010 [Polyangiaceae bacterium]
MEGGAGVSGAPAGGTGGNAGTNTGGNAGSDAGAPMGQLVASAEILDEIAVDNTNIYYASSALMKLPKTGGTSSSLADELILGLAIDESNAYFGVVGISDDLMRVPLVGGTPSVVAATPGAVILSIAVGPSDVYWSDLNSGVRRAPKSGGVATTLSDATPVGIDVDAAYLYWADCGAGEIRRLPLAGGGAETVAKGDPCLAKVKVDATSVYWAEVNTATILKAPLAGGTTQVLVPQSSSLGQIALDEANLYFGDTRGVIQRVAKPGGPPTNVAAGPADSAVLEIAVDATHVYWVAKPVTGAKVLMRAPK